MKLKNGKMLNANEKVREHKVKDLENQQKKKKKIKVELTNLEGRVAIRAHGAMVGRCDLSVWLARLLVVVARWERR